MALKTFGVTLHFFSPTGARLGVLERDQVSTLARQMPFNGGQTMTVQIPRPLAQEALCRHGNLLVIEADSGVELWGGVIRGPRRWSLEGPSVTIQTWETFLADLYTPQELTLQGLSAGGMVKRLLSDALAKANVPLVMGQVSDAGLVQTREFRQESILSVVQSLSENGGAFDWWCECVWSDRQDKPHGVFHLLPRAGRKTSILLAEGYNVTDVQKSDDDSAAVTQATVIANANSEWGERPVVTVTDAALAQALGWQRAQTAIRTDIAGGDAARVAAKAMLGGVEESLVLGISNQNGEWGSIRSGDSLLVDLPSFDFQDMATGYREPVRRRVVGRQPDEASGVMSVQLARP